MIRYRNITKRSLMMLLVAWITFMSVFHAYEQTTQCAEWVAGVVTAIGGAPLLTALMIGGVVVAGGIAIHELAQTDAEDWRNFANGIKQGFNEFVSEQETIIAKEQDQTLSDQEAANIGVAVARDKVNGFFSNAVSTVKNKAENIKLDVMEYWNLYSKIINGVADHGINEPITDTTVIPMTYGNLFNYNFTVAQMSNIGSNCYLMPNGHYYVLRGQFYRADGSTWTLSRLNGSYDRIPFMTIHIVYSEYYDTYTVSCNAYDVLYDGGRVDLNTYFGSPSMHSLSYQNMITLVNQMISNTNFPLFINASTSDSDIFNEFIYDHKYLSTLSVGSTSVDVPKDYESTINDILKNTRAGQAIQTGRRTLVNSGDHIIGVFQEDSVPVRKSGVVVQDGVVSAPLGWDIPVGGVWDDVLSGGKPYADVVGGTGAIGVPDDVITGTKSGDTVIEYPDSASVQDSADYPRSGTDDPAIDDSKPQEIPEKPQTDVFDDQGGSFYPAVMDLTNIFPFCIPFDIIYLVDKFDIHGERAPVIEIPIVYPTLLQNSLGESYTVVIDFNDFLVVRNVLRIFLLILFIVGLLKITRDLIRG